MEYIQFRRLLEYKDKIQHCYTMYNDYEKDDGRNYKMLYQSLKLDYNSLVNIKKQVHSNLVEKVEDKQKIYNNIDGLITNKRQISFSLRFADCTPIYIYDPVKNAIGNIHSGWRGTAKKIVQVAIKKMINEYGSNPQDIICCLGPAIGKCHFEVDEEIKEIFKQTFSYMNITEEIIQKGEMQEGKQKYVIDTNLINKKMIEELGIKRTNIIESNLCTVCNKDVFHSYRADKNKAGRNTAILGLI